VLLPEQQPLLVSDIVMLRNSMLNHISDSLLIMDLDFVGWGIGEVLGA
jgi:hypothetical protein